MLLLQLHFDIYRVLNKNNMFYFFMVYFIHILWLFHPAVVDQYGHYIDSKEYTSSSQNTTDNHHWASSLE